MYRILIVDDSWLQRQLINNVLKDHDFEIIEASGGKDALKKAEEEKPDCIILDLLMPDISGIEVLKFINEKNMKIPVIILSADIQNTTRSQCFELGASAFLNKPANSNELLNAISSILDKRSA